MLLVSSPADQSLQYFSSRVSENRRLFRERKVVTCEEFLWTINHIWVIVTNGLCFFLFFLNCCLFTGEKKCVSTPYRHYYFEWWMRRGRKTLQPLIIWPPPKKNGRFSNWCRISRALLVVRVDSQQIEGFSFWTKICGYWTEIWRITHLLQECVTVVHESMGVPR